MKTSSVSERWLSFAMLRELRFCAMGIPKSVTLFTKPLSFYVRKIDSNGIPHCMALYVTQLAHFVLRLMLTKHFPRYADSMFSPVT